MFLVYLAKDPHFYVYAVVTLVFSIVLHELAHGWAALWQGDQTPRVHGHMTIDPRVHMGPVSLVMVFVLGIGFGAMPVDPTRFRGRHGDLLVSLAGPAMNLTLAFVALTGVALWELASPEHSSASVEGSNLWRFLWTFGYMNVALGVFNLVPLPPLDGATVLAGLHGGYRRLIGSVRNPMVFLFAFLLFWSLLGATKDGFYGFAADWSRGYVEWLYALAGR